MLPVIPTLELQLPETPAGTTAAARLWVWGWTIPRTNDTYRGDGKAVPVVTFLLAGAVNLNTHSHVAWCHTG